VQSSFAYYSTVKVEKQYPYNVSFLIPCTGKRNIFGEKVTEFALLL